MSNLNLIPILITTNNPNPQTILNQMVKQILKVRLSMYLVIRNWRCRSPTKDLNIINIEIESESTPERESEGESESESKSKSDSESESKWEKLGGREIESERESESERETESEIERVRGRLRE